MLIIRHLDRQIVMHDIMQSLINEFVERYSCPEKNKGHKYLSRDLST